MGVEVTKLDKPIKRIVHTLQGDAVIVEIHPADEGMHAHIKFRKPGAQRSFFTKTIELLPENGSKIAIDPRSVTSSSPVGPSKLTGLPESKP